MDEHEIEELTEKEAPIPRWEIPRLEYALRSEELSRRLAKYGIEQFAKVGRLGAVREVWLRDARHKTFLCGLLNEWGLVTTFCLGSGEGLERMLQVVSSVHHCVLRVYP